MLASKYFFYHCCANSFLILRVTVSHIAALAPIPFTSTNNKRLLGVRSRPRAGIWPVSSSLTSQAYQ